MVDYTPEDLAALATAIYGEARNEIHKGQSGLRAALFVDRLGRPDEGAEAFQRTKPPAGCM